MTSSSKGFRDKYIGKLTMKEPYDKSKYLSKRARGLVDIVRPFTLLAPYLVSLSLIVASMIYNNVPLPDNWWFIAGNAALTVTIVNAASNALNQATDVEADKISKPYRPIPRGIIRADGAQSLAYILYLFALLRAVSINIWFGTFIFLIMIFTVTYSLPPRMKQYLFINQIWIAIPRGMLGILAGWSVFGSDYLFTDATPWIIGGIATVYLIGGMSTKDITDRIADMETGTRTLINTYGTKKTALICFPFMFFPFAFIPIFINQGLLESYLWPLTSLLLLSCFIFYLMIRKSESKTLENVHAWAIMYILYILFALGFAVLTIFKGFENIQIGF